MKLIRQVANIWNSVCGRETIGVAINFEMTDNCDCTGKRNKLHKKYKISYTIM